WILAQQPIIESNRLEWTVGVGDVATGRDPALRGCALLEILIGLPHASERIRRADGAVRKCLGGVGGRPFSRPGVSPAYSKLLFELQVRETPHRFRSHHVLWCIL